MTSEQILRDPLTGAHSRATLQDRLREEVERARRYSLPLSLLILDLDHFKTVNDAFGHTRGDLILTGFTERVRGVARDSDLLFRYGGDEFVLLLLHTDRDHAMKFAARLLESIRALPFPGSPPLTLTLSIGSASFPEDGQSGEDLFERADRRLYYAKHQGRGRVIADDPVMPGRLSFDTTTRLMERELPLVKLRQFLDDLVQHKRGTFTITGPAGVGKTWFLAELVKSARLRGYAVWSIRALPALRARVFGALSEAQAPVEGLPPPAAGEQRFVRALQAALTDQAKAGLVLAVDNLAELDRASFELVCRMLFAPELNVAALAFTLEPDGPNRVPPFDAPLQARVDLRPFSPLGVRLWLRAVLRWEAPEGVAGWLHRETGGLPGRLEQALTYLLDSELLRAQDAGWMFVQPYDSLQLSENLEALGHTILDNLPATPTNFVGRETELAALKRRVSAEPITTVVAPGGMGKTRLALQAAAEMKSDFTHGVFFIPLSAVTEVDDLITNMVDAIGMTLAGAVQRGPQLLNFLAERTLLLILDNVEYLLPAASLLADIRARAPNVKLLVTSRERLNLHGESVFELRGLPLPPAVSSLNRPSVRPPGDYAAEQLFVQSARRVLPDFELAEDDRLYIRRVCELVEGMPLAIELAAAWVPLFTCREIAFQIERSLDFLATGRVEVPERQRSARAVLDYFWSLLAEDERRRLRALAVFRAGFTLEAAQATADASLFFLSALVDKAFLRKGTSGRYEMQELLRQYAEAKLNELPREQAAAHDNHGRYFARFLAQRFDMLKDSRQAEALGAIQADLANVRAAWRWATAQGCTEAVEQCIDGLQLFCDIQGWYDEGAEAFARAVESWRSADSAAAARATPTLARILAGQAVFLHRLGHDTRAHNLLNEAQSLLVEAQSTDRGPGAAAVLCALGQVSLGLGALAEARSWFEQSLDLHLAADDQYGRAAALDGLGSVAVATGDYATARGLFSEGLAVRRTLGDRHGMIATLTQAGQLALEAGDLVEAQSALEEAAALGAAAGRRWATKAGPRDLGHLALACGEAARARSLFEEALKLHTDIGHAREAALDLLALGAALGGAGDAQGARTHYHQALNGLRECGDRRGVLLAVLGLGQCAAVGSPTASTARDYYSEALNMAREIGALPLALTAIAGLAEQSAAAGQTTLAIRALTRVLCHSASPRATQEAATNGLSRLESELPAGEVAAAEESGRHADLDELAATLLAA